MWATAWLTVVAIILVVSVGDGVASTQPVASEDSVETAWAVARYERQNRALATQLALASGEDFYLLLDTAVLQLRLMLGGAELATLPVRAIEIGRRQVLLIRGAPVPWRDIVWENGTLQPQRPDKRTIISAKKGDQAVPTLVPPPVEQTIPVPSRYLIRFAGGFALEVRSVDGGDGPASFWDRTADGLLVALGDAWSAAFGRDLARLRLWLSRTDAEALYRALPPAPCFLAASTS
jgi:hypothetical protein